MKRIYLVTGLPLAGKSTVARQLHGLLDDAELISTGDIARTLIADDEVMKSEMYAKDLFTDEDRMRKAVYDAVENSKCYNIVVEGMPRFGAQVEFIKDKFWHYFPKILIAEVGDLITLWKRAKERARDERDTDDSALMARLELATKNMSDVKGVANNSFIPYYGVFTTGETILQLKYLNKIIAEK